MSRVTIYRATYTRMGGRVTSSHDMTQEYVETEQRGAMHLAFWASAPDYITCDSTVALLNVERIRY